MRPELGKKTFDNSYILSAKIPIVSPIDVQLSYLSTTIFDIIKEIYFTTQQTNRNVWADAHQLSG